MAIKFSELWQDERFGVKNRRDLKAFYEDIKQATREGKLNLEGHSLPTTMNAWIRGLEPDKKPLAGDYDVVDFSLAEDEAFTRWQRAYLERQAVAVAARHTVYVSQNSKDMLDSVQMLERAHEDSLLKGNAKKEDVVSALSDLQAAAYDLLATYDKVREGLRLPDRRLPAEKVKVKQVKAKKAKR